VPPRLTSFLQFLTHLANSHPYTWYLGWQAVWHLRFLLPHEQGFNALRHFVAIRPEGLFLDVGANNGISALSLRRFSTRYRILSIEPNPLLEAPLKKIKEGDDRFDYLIAGAAAEPGRISFFVPTWRGVVLHTATSAVKEQVYDAVAHWFSPSIAARTTITAFESPIVRLDDLSLEPAIVKIDAEGHDYDALVGLSRTIDRARPFFIIEMEWAANDKIHGLLAAKDYRQLSYDAAKDTFQLTETFDPKLGHNAFFVPAELASRLPGIR
jgi:FkbM family methyltransferase